MKTNKQSILESQLASTVRRLAAALGLRPSGKAKAELVEHLSRDNRISVSDVLNSLNRTELVRACRSHSLRVTGSAENLRLTLLVSSNERKPVRTSKKKAARARPSYAAVKRSSLPMLRGLRVHAAGKTTAARILPKKVRASPDQNFAVVRVHYATDRKRKSQDGPTVAFGWGRGKLSFGHCDVSIPRDHRMGALEGPSIWRLEFRPDPKKHVALLGTVAQTQEEFYRDLEERMKKGGASSALLFVHGYNVSFEDAARRTAQMSYDLGFGGAPIFYSWPSRGSMKSYTRDEQSIEWSQSNLVAFLTDFFTTSNAKSVYLVAHSMGSRALTRAIAELLRQKPALRSRLTEIILAAPDIDAEVFVRDIVPAFPSRRPITLYASSSDRALAASKKVHGASRAGDAGEDLVVVTGVETVDATLVSTDFLGHSYYAENRSILSDIFYLLDSGTRADKRFGLRRVTTVKGRHWEFKL